MGYNSIYLSFYLHARLLSIIILSILCLYGTTSQTKKSQWKKDNLTKTIVKCKKFATWLSEWLTEKHQTYQLNIFHYPQKVLEPSVWMIKGKKKVWSERMSTKICIIINKKNNELHFVSMIIRVSSAWCVWIGFHCRTGTAAREVSLPFPNQRTLHSYLGAKLLYEPVDPSLTRYLTHNVPVRTRVNTWTLVHPILTVAVLFVCLYFCRSFLVNCFAPMDILS